jgi:hypothetical protein
MINAHQGKFARRSVTRVWISGVGSLGVAVAVEDCSEFHPTSYKVKAENLTGIESIMVVRQDRITSNQA